MRNLYRAVSITLAFLLSLYWLPQGFDLSSPAYAYDGESSGSYPVDYSASGYALGLTQNGDAAISENVIQLERGEAGGGSVFTNNKVDLGESLSFSSSFSLDITPPSALSESTSGIAFTLQGVGNTAYAGDLQYDGITPSLSIAFVTEYRSAAVVMSAERGESAASDVSDSTRLMGGEPPLQRTEKAVLYVNGDYANGITLYEKYFSIDDPHHFDVLLDHEVLDGDNYLNLLCKNPGFIDGEFYRSVYIDEALLAPISGMTECYAGFIGPLGSDGYACSVTGWTLSDELGLFDAAMVEADFKSLSALMEQQTSAPCGSLNLPTVGKYDSDISWTSSNHEAVRPGDGGEAPEILYPAPKEPTKSVTLSAVISRGTQNRSAGPYTVTLTATDYSVMNADYEWLTDSVIKGENPSLENVISDLYLPTTGSCGSTITWSSDNPDVLSTSGVVSRPAVLAGDVTVTLSASVKKNDQQGEKPFTIVVKAIAASDADITEGDHAWLTNALILAQNSALDNVTAKLNLPVSGQYGSLISWSSSDEAVVTTEGEVTRPSFTAGSKALTLTAVISRGGASETKVFSISVPALEQTDAERVAADLAALDETDILGDNTALNNVLDNLTLPRNGASLSGINWSSSDSSVVTNAGAVIRPAYTEGDKTVTLTANIRYRDASASKQFTLTVIKLEPTDAERVALDAAALDDAAILGGNTALDSIVGDLSLPTLGALGSVISWASSDDSCVDTDGTVNRPSYTVGSKGLTLTATVTKGESSDSKQFDLTVIRLEATETEIAQAADFAALNAAAILGGNTALSNVVGDLTLPTLGASGSAISWTSSDEACVDTDGVVRRPSYTEGSREVTLTAVVTKGGISGSKQFTVTVIRLDPTDAERVAFDAAALNAAAILNGNTALNNVVGDLSLPTSGAFDSAISWSSSYEVCVDTTGVVMRPGYTEGDKQVTLTAIVAKGEASVEKQFTVTVVRLNMTEAERERSVVETAAAMLTDSELLADNSGLNNVRTNLSLPSRTGASWAPVMISWSSDNPEVLSSGGIVTRPSFTKGDVSVTLTARLTYGSVSTTKQFTVIVSKKDPTPTEMLTADWLELTEELILWKNDSADDVHSDLFLPTSGSWDSDISWYSSYSNVINTQGEVSPRRFTEGPRDVTLTAVLTNGYGSRMIKNFTLTVQPFEISESEKYARDCNWLRNQGILRANPSAYAVTTDLYFPVQCGEYDSTVVWSSDDTAVISNTGTVTRPPYGSGHRTVTVSAVLSLPEGSDTRVETYTFMVLQQPDTAAPEVLSSLPARNAENVRIDTRSITVAYNESIALSDDHGITLEGSDGIDFRTSAQDSKLILSLTGELSPGLNTLTIPAGAVSDMAGNPAPAFALSFTVEARQVRKIGIVSSTPRNMQRDAKSSHSATIVFDSDEISLSSPYSLVEVSCLTQSGGESYSLCRATLSGSTLTVSLDSSYSGALYEICLDKGLVCDRFGNTNERETIAFRIASSGGNPEIVSSFPENGAYGFSVRQTTFKIELTKELPRYRYPRFTLTDVESGTDYPLYTESEGTTLYLRPGGLKQLKPLTFYRITGTYDVQGSSDFGFELYFTSGGDTLPCNVTSPAASNVGASPKIRIAFAVPVHETAEAADISLTDSDGNKYLISTSLSNREAFIETSYLLPGKSYTLNVPQGAYEDADYHLNDAFSYAFSTAAPLDISSDDIMWPEVGFAGRELYLDTSALNELAASKGRSIRSIEWYADDEYLGTTGSRPYLHTFTELGTHTVSVSFVDSRGFSYIESREIEIVPFGTVEMRYLGAATQTDEAGVPQSITFNLTLTSPELMGGFVSEGEITASLYRRGAFQRKVAILTPSYSDNTYSCKYLPSEEEAGTYEMVFTYEGPGTEEPLVERAAFQLKEPVYTESFKFKLRDFRYYDAFFDERESLTVKLNSSDEDSAMTCIANRQWDDEDGCYVYALDEPIESHSYFDFQIVNWKLLSGEASVRIYSGTDDSEPTVICGEPREPKGLSEVSINYAECSVEEPFSALFFKGEAADSGVLALNVQGDWSDVPGYAGSNQAFEPGYYELRSTSGRLIMTVKANKDGSPQVIKLKPALYLEEGEQLCIRMLPYTSDASAWTASAYTYCPKITVLSQPTLMGEKIPVRYVQTSPGKGKYYATWPGAFESMNGDPIPQLKGVPVLNGGSFGVSGQLPHFEGSLAGRDSVGSLGLSFGARMDAETSSKKLSPTKYKKLQKVKVVGYDFGFGVDGLMEMSYSNDGWDYPWGRIIIDGYAEAEWSVGYELLGIGFTAGVGVGGSVWSELMYKYEDDDEEEYSGIILITPKAWLFADVDAVVGGVNGSMIARLPATIHYPSGYIGAGINVNCLITGYLFGSETTLYEKRLFGVHWDNGEEKLVLTAVDDAGQELSGEKELSFRLLPRDYLNRASGADSDVSLLGLTAENEQLIAQNIYPKTETALAANGDELWLVWTEDDPDRDDINRTRLRCRILKDGSWGEPFWLDSAYGDDGTADFEPVTAAVGDGVLAAWVNMREIMDNDAALDVMLKNTEISVTKTPYSAEGSAPEFVTLTSGDDESINHSPALAACGDRALLVWTSSTQLGFNLTGEPLSEPQGDVFRFSTWENGSWSGAQQLGDASYRLLNSSLIMDGERALLLYTADMDKNLATTDDREIFTRQYDGTSWGDALRLTENGQEDSSPKAAVIGGEWFITWLRGAELMYQIGLDGEETRCEGALVSSGIYSLSARTGDSPLAGLVYTQGAADGKTGVSAFFYDVESGQWSDSTALVQADRSVGAVSAAFTQDGALSVGFSQADVITLAVPDSENAAQESIGVSDLVELRVLTYDPAHDLALLPEDGMYLSREFPLPDTITTVYLTLRNEGDFTEKAVLSLYDGDPKNGGKPLTLLGETPVYTIAAHSAVEVELDWLVDSAERDAYELYALISSADAVTEKSDDNNTISLSFNTADLEAVSLTAVNTTGDEYLVSAVIENTGALSLTGSSARLEDAVSGETIETIPLEVLAAGERAEFNRIIRAAELSDGSVLRLRVEPPSGIREEFEYNNVFDLTMTPSPLEVINASPGPGEEHVALTKTLRLVFNRELEAGVGYDRIALVSDSLESVAINKEISGDTLVITAAAPLETAAKYFLTIPADALKADAHSMESEFRLSFSTTVHNPEVVYAYPGDTMTDTPVDTVIKLRYNQSVLKGGGFSKIVLKDSQGQPVSASAAVNAEYLSLTPARALEADSSYTLEVPAGAVQNESGETMWRDYVLSFTTGSAGASGGVRFVTVNENGSIELSPGSRENGSVTVSRWNAVSGSIITVTAVPNEGYRLHSLIVTDKDGNELELVGQDGSYTFTMPASSVTVSCVFTDNDEPFVNTFDDVSENDYFYEAVLWALEKDITKGTGEKTFSPKAPCTRAQIVTFLWRASGSPEPVSLQTDFDDVATDAFYRKAVLWAVENKITLGTTSNTFNPEKVCTRDQALTLLYRYIGSPAVDGDSSFTDVETGDYFHDAVVWAQQNAISNGTSDTTFSPSDDCTRAQILTLLFRLLGEETPGAVPAA